LNGFTVTLVVGLDQILGGQRDESDGLDDPPTLSPAAECGEGI
jgi:hypothetical protein